jgi:4-hydroxy-3-methylbut-2-enyl diphosphate reductase
MPRQIPYRVPVPRPVVFAPMRVEKWALRRGFPADAVVRVGMGRERSLAAVGRLHESAYDAVVVGGVCGSLDPDLTSKQVLVASEVRAGDVGTIPTTDPQRLAAALQSAGYDVRVGPIASVPKLEFGKHAHDRLRDAGAAAVDMESAWLATAAGARPLHVIRIPSDGPSEPLLHPGVAVWGTRALLNLARVSRELARYLGGA